MEREVTVDGLSCREIFELLSAYLDAELPPGLCTRLSAHIEGCGPCVEFVESLRRAIELFRGFEGRETPPPLSEEAREKLRLAYAGVIDATDQSNLESPLGKVVE